MPHRITIRMIESKLAAMNEMVFGWNNENIPDYYKDEQYLIYENEYGVSIEYSGIDTSGVSTIIHSCPKRECFNQMNAFIEGYRCCERDQTE